MIESILEMPAEASVGVSDAGTATTDQADVPLSRQLLGKINAHWRAANYLSVGQIYLHDNPLFKEPLKLSHVKPLVGHWGTTPGQNFIYVQLNRVINVVDLMKLQSASEHPHGLSETGYDSLFTKDKHIVFGFHKLIEHKHFIDQYGEDMREIRNRKWPLSCASNGDPKTPEKKMTKVEVSV